MCKVASWLNRSFSRRGHCLVYGREDTFFLLDLWCRLSPCGWLWHSQLCRACEWCVGQAALLKTSSIWACLWLLLPWSKVSSPWGEEGMVGQGQCLKGCRYVGTVAKQPWEALEHGEYTGTGSQGQVGPVLICSPSSSLYVQIIHSKGSSLSAAGNWASLQYLTLGPRLFLGFNSKVYINVPRATMGGVHLRLGAYSTGIWFYSSFYGQWSANKYKPPGSSMMCFSLMWNELHSELCCLFFPDDNGNLGSNQWVTLQSRWGEVDPTTSSHKNHQLGRAEARGGTVELVQAVCWLLACRCSHVCNSTIAHTTHCCQEAWEKIEGREEMLWWGLTFRDGEKDETLCARAQRKWRIRHAVAIEMGHMEDDFRPRLSESSCLREQLGYFYPAPEAWIFPHSPWMWYTAWQLTVTVSWRVGLLRGSGSVPHDFSGRCLSIMNLFFGPWLCLFGWSWRTSCQINVKGLMSKALLSLWSSVSFSQAYLVLKNNVKSQETAWLAV